MAASGEATGRDRGVRSEAATARLSVAGDSAVSSEAATARPSVAGDSAVS